MSRRKTSIGREAQAKRNANNKTKSAAVSSKKVLVNRRVEQGRADAEREVAAVYAGVLIEVCREYYDGDVKYSALCATDENRGREMQETVSRELATYIDKEQTPQLVAEAADIVQELNQKWIDTGFLIPTNLRLWDVPTARIYFKSGVVEAVNRARDMDVRDMGSRFRTAMAEYEESKKGGARGVR
jgi:hypothetical protein